MISFFCGQIEGQLYQICGGMSKIERKSVKIKKGEEIRWQFQNWVKKFTLVLLIFKLYTFGPSIF